MICFQKLKEKQLQLESKFIRKQKDSADVKLASAKLNLEAKSAEFAKSLQDETKALKALFIVINATI